MRVIVAPDSFKGSASAADVAAALVDGWRSVRPADELVVAPMADGGEGTLDAVSEATPGSTRMPVTVTGPHGRPVPAEWLLLEAPDGASTGLVELALCSGIELLDELAPDTAHTLGFGQAIRAALDHGVDRLLLALGGSSSSDGGAGALTALGARLLDVHGAAVPLGNAGLARIAAVDWASVAPLPAGGALLLSDVDNPLLGDRGAVAVFGAQKGVTADRARAAESALARFADALAENPGVARADAPGAGAAGGTGFGMLTWGATMSSGSRAIAETIGLPASIASADLVITGEGRFDGQSAGGKAPVEVLRLARSSGVRRALVAGLIDAPPVGFDTAVSLSELAGSSAASLADPLRWAREAGRRLALG
ncbi:MAG: glycerate kinase [Actinobacteria bacterium]|nr:glycerate kinase [Actinomycetota bacterium]MBU1608761.1 glycerate kinase [Actinomycetota bacterium]MBU2316332.1 glycerate kinase [Actinomycetota bacterium]MBU2385822.1 glycerate kinase [Actinomycetota bacterium]